jgi:predicted acylesterase/phospholipase RssA
MKHLAIGPGAVGYFALMGALNKLWDSGMLKDLETMSGSSAGALLCCMAALTNFDFVQMMNISLKVPLENLKPQIKSLFMTYGLIPRDTIRDMIIDTMIPGRNDLTFRELYEIFPKRIYISAFCVQLTQTHYFSVVTHPDMSVIDALCMSISVPFLFSSFRYGEWIYLDGGTIESAPCAPYLGEPREDVMVLRLQFKDTYDVKDFVSYVYMIFSSVCKIRYVYDFPTTYIDIGDTDVLEFSCSDELKIRLFTEGYKI